MNGSENGYAGALFFALVSLGAIFKVDDVIGLFVGATAALFAAISLRRALVQAAQAAEEDHQRIEIQLQQLRSKVSETSSVNVQAMTSVGEAAQLLQENLEVIRVRLAELDNLTDLTGHADTIRQTLAALEEDSIALNTSLEKIFAVVSQEKGSDTSDLVAQSFIALTDEIKRINDNAAFNKNSLETALKLLQFIAQEIKNPAYVKELEKINSSVETLAARTETLTICTETLSARADFDEYFDELKNSVAAVEKNLAELVRIDANLSKNPACVKELEKINSSVETLTARTETLITCTETLSARTDFDALKISVKGVEKSLSELVRINSNLSRNFSSTFDDLRLDVAKLSAKLETLSSPTDNRAALTSQDINLLKKIAAKINLK